MLWQYGKNKIVSSTKLIDGGFYVSFYVRLWHSDTQPIQFEYTVRSVAR